MEVGIMYGSMDGLLSLGDTDCRSPLDTDSRLDPQLPMKIGKCVTALSASPHTHYWQQIQSRNERTQDLALSPDHVNQDKENV